MVKKFRLFHELVKKRLDQGESVESAYRDKPEGYTEWAKIQFDEQGGITLPPFGGPKVICWNDGFEYFMYMTKCPKCGAFNKERRLIKK